ncbi:anthranilate synthase family protein [Phytoactinopolyspora mesophila]|uniref:anthranilate synthase n=1 Tax=Phytoactinopolyspora mesophila TaxID=2650750 RepID=A0A7K3MC75_9ACTN|nr:anthranilate synthase family protein [Phytoactinopolyspora mesophila]NDL60866.1 hypothetical protein [Phytoactinopolyspora mesophila]
MISRLTELFNQPVPPPFAVLNRSEGPGVELLFGEVRDVASLAEIPPPPGQEGGDPAVLALVPYRQIAERGFAAHDDATPLRCLIATERVVLDRDEVIAALPADPVDIVGNGFDIDDDTYAAIVGNVVRDEIGHGAGANFVIRRDYRARLTGSVPHTALRLFRRLLTSEPNAYWTFAIHAGDVTMVGATPERHVSVTGGTVVMNPISGTYRAPDSGATTDGLQRFLADPKETEELFMVVDEELKMMSHICDQGGQVLGPYLKEMGHLVHTEYLLEGRTALDIRDVLRETMFAPTVTGSPIENAARVITRYEPTGRGYYAGMAALIGRDPRGRPALDAPILIRTAYLEPDGRIHVPVGATLVRHSVPEHEVAETHAKAAGVLAALGLRASPKASTSTGRFAEHPGIAQALDRRNSALAPFWLRRQAPEERPLSADAAGCSALIVDAEDRWTAMLAHLLGRIGMRTDVRRWDGTFDADDYDLLIAGPGPGDPRDTTDPRVMRLRRLMSDRMTSRRPMLAVCLSHQILAGLLGLPITALAQPHQGTQRKIELFGRSTLVGFYNTFAGFLPTPVTTPAVAGNYLGTAIALEVAADVKTGELHAMRGAGFASVQFHLESILSTEGVDLLAEIVGDLLRAHQHAGLTQPRVDGIER